MTHQDPVNAPSCPICTTRDMVTRDRLGHRHIYLCGCCQTVFVGSQEEWAHLEKQRTIYANHKRNMEAK